MKGVSIIGIVLGISGVIVFVQDCITQSCIHKIILKLHLEYS